MGIIIKKWRVLALIVSMIAALTLVACGGDAAAESNEVAEAATVANPTATQVVIEVTVAPIPTETPVPTIAPEPTQKPAPAIDKDFGPRTLAETKAQPMVDFPEEITKGSPILDDDQVIAHWTEFIENTRSIAFSDSLIWELCPGGEGTWVYELGSPNYTGAKFDYELVADPGGSWNSIVVVYKFRDKTLFDLMNTTNGAGARVAFQGVKAGEPSKFYEGLSCG